MIIASNARKKMATIKYFLKIKSEENMIVTLETVLEFLKILNKITIHSSNSTLRPKRHETMSTQKLVHNCS